jgi:hypothetical protein
MDFQALVSFFMISGEVEIKIPVQIAEENLKNQTAVCNI